MSFGGVAMCLVSVIVPVYNVELYLADCLDSIFAQTYDKLELIAVDDGSTDRSPEILQHYLDEGYLFRVIRQANQGLGGARNTGLRAATGKYIFFVDSDDTIERKAVEKAVAAAEQTKADITLFNFRHTDLNGVEIQAFDNDQLGLPVLMPLNLKDHGAIFFTLSSPCSRLFKREFLQENQLKFVNRIWFEDLLFFLQTLLYNPVYCYLPEVLYNYRQHGASITKSFHSNKNIDIITVFENVLNDYKNADAYERYKQEIHYLALEHIYTGILYILAKAGRFNLYRTIKERYFQLFPNINSQLRRRLPLKKRLIAKLIDWDLVKLIHIFKKA